ncbi:gas vesicle protein [Streptomyces sp. NPDC045431]|uniref:gas vesicle protein GvpO n=1 Tax=Streptomyces sp. NPDC045431 TaxID=3155613 RepID=UPI0033F0D8D4
MPSERQTSGRHPHDPRDERRQEERRPEAHRDGQGTGQRLPAPKAMRLAVDQLKELLGRAPESISALRPIDDGWEAEVEVLELERIPVTTSVLASYRVTLDAEGELMAYERIRRYTRGQIDSRT